MKIWMTISFFLLLYFGEAGDLMAIANQCPHAGGEAVYQARALLNDGMVYDDQTLCQPGMQLKKPAESSATPFFSVYPNPGALFTRVELEDEAKEAGEVVLSDALGRQVLVQTFRKGDQTIPLMLEEVPGGMYYLTVTSGQVIDTQVFIHLR